MQEDNNEEIEEENLSVQLNDNEGGEENNIQNPSTEISETQT
jgi:hypothetical protein